MPHVLYVQVSLQRSYDEVDFSLAGARQEVSSLKSTVSQMVADASTIHCQLEAVKVTLAKIFDTLELITCIMYAVTSRMNF